MHITPRHLATAIKKVEQLSLSAQEHRLDELYVTQPNLLASVLVQQQMGNSLAQTEVLLHLLLVIDVAYKEAGFQVATISESAQAEQLARYTAYLTALEKQSKKAARQATQAYIDAHPEKVLLGYVNQVMRDAGFTAAGQESAKYLILTGINLVNCYANAAMTRQ